MNTTTNTRVSEATVEQIEAAFEQWENDASVVSLFAAFKAGVAYAATLRQNPERRVSSEEVRLSLDYSRNFARANPRLSKTTVEHIEGLCNLVERLAALSAEPAAQGEAVLIEAVGRVERDMTGELGINWLVEGGIHALIEGSVLLCSEHDHLTDDDGSATLYTAPPAPPAERVPEGEVRLWDTQWMNIVNHDNCYRDWDKADAINHAVKMTEQAIARNVADGKLPSARTTASPAPSEGGKGGSRSPFCGLCGGVFAYDTLGKKHCACTTGATR